MEYYNIEVLDKEFHKVFIIFFMQRLEVNDHQGFIKELCISCYKDPFRISDELILLYKDYIERGGDPDEWLVYTIRLIKRLPSLKLDERKAIIDELVFQLNTELKPGESKRGQMSGRIRELIKDENPDHHPESAKAWAYENALKYGYKQESFYRTFLRIRNTE